MLSFLSGGGQMGAAVRTHDWTATPLGSPETWPTALKTLVGVMLGSNQPMFLAWGPEQILLYNDPYAAILAGKHPGALGRPFLNVWSEISTDLGPIVGQAYRGEPVHMDDITLWMERRGYLEETHFAFSYTPIRGEGGTVQGFFCACTETTAQVLAERTRQVEVERQRQLFEQAPGFIAVLAEPDHRFQFANQAYRDLIGGRDPIGRTVREVLPELEDQQFFSLLDKVFESGERHIAHDTIARLETSPGALEDRFLDFVFEPVRDDTDKVTGIFVEGHDVTDAHLAREAVRQSEERLRLVIDGARDYAIFTVDPERHVTSWSDGAGVAFGYTAEEMIGQSADVLFTPEDRAAGQPIIEVERAQQEGCGPDVRWHLRKDGSRVFLNGSLRPLHAPNGGLLGYLKVARDETERHSAEERLRESEARLRALTDNLPSGMVYQISTGRDGSERRFLYVSQSHEKLTGVPAEAVLANAAVAYDLIVPDDRSLLVEAEADAIRNGKPFDVQARFSRVNGEVRWSRIISAPREQPDGSIIWDGIQVDITDQKNAEALLLESNRSLEARVLERTAERDRMWETSPDLMLVVDAKGIIRRVNPAWTATLGYEPDELVGRHVFDFVLPEDQKATAQVAKLAASGGRPKIDNQYRHKDGSIRWISWVAAPAGDVTYATGRDVTEEKEREAELERTQEQLRQAQKMEAVGQLTGGIAHDFNNLLTGVIGSLDMMQRQIAKGETSKVQRYATTAMTAANRAAALTHRLLAFARRQPLDPKPVNSNRLVTGMEELLRRTIGETVSLEIVTAGGLWQTLCDPNQLESAILNLAINARDAMPEGGKLTIETCNTRLDSVYAARQRELKPGQYVCICVTDTGGGMSADVVAKAFDPFFTTKPIGQGTGLGLSMIYGFARQSEGYARIYSEVGQGTTVKLYLPRYYGEAEDTDTDRGELTDAHRSDAGETVLVVEDEAAVRDLVVDVLEELGYRAIEAADGPSGLELLQSDVQLDLLISDVGLPGLNGRQLADAARKHRPELKVLFMTGYAENATIANGFLDPGMEMITKPFAIEALATRIRDMIEERSP
jgi:PAS domain S-box-containing protein